MNKLESDHLSTIYINYTKASDFRYASLIIGCIIDIDALTELQLSRPLYVVLIFYLA